MKAVQKEDTLLDGESHRNFVCSLKSSFTRDTYAKALLHFMKFRNISASDDLVKEDPRIIQSNIIEWLIHLKEVKKLSSASITLYCAAIHHFYDMNDIVGLNWNKFIIRQIQMTHCNNNLQIIKYHQSNTK